MFLSAVISVLAGLMIATWRADLVSLGLVMSMGIALIHPTFLLVTLLLVIFTMSPRDYVQNASK